MDHENDIIVKLFVVQLRSQYPQGIDRAPRCVSTKLEKIVIPPPPRNIDDDDPYAKYDRENPQSAWNRYLEFTRRPELRYQRHLHFNENKFTPGEVLAARRKEQLEHRMERDRLGITDDAVTTTGSDQALALTDGSSSTAVTTTSSPSTATAGGDGTATAVAEGEQAHPAGTNAAGTGTSAPAEQSTGGRRGLLSLPAIIEAKIHEKKYPPGHLAAVQAAHIALDGQLRGRKGQRGRNNKRQSVDAARLRRTSANAFAAGIASAVSTSASAADSVPATSS